MSRDCPLVVVTPSSDYMYCSRNWEILSSEFREVHCIMKDRAKSVARQGCAFNQLVFGAKVVHGKIVFFHLQVIFLFIIWKDCSSQKVMAMEKDPLRALPWYQCFMRVRVGPASCPILMNFYSSMNLVSKTVVDAWNLSLAEHPEPYELWWTDKFFQDHASR